MTVINLCHLLINFKLLSTTCAQPCTNCVPQRTQPYQYVVNVPVVPVQGVAVPANTQQQPCCGNQGQTATQTVFWYNTGGNGQQNSGMLSNFTAISPQSPFNYQNPNGQQQQGGPSTGGNYISPTTMSPVTPGNTFTTPAPNYNPDVYLQGSTSQGPTAQTLSPGGVFVGAGNQQYNQGQGVTPGQMEQGGTYNSANSEFLAPQNEGLYQRGPNQGGNTQGNYYPGNQQNQGQQFPGAQGEFQTTQGQFGQGQQGGQFTQGGQFPGQQVQGNQFQGQGTQNGQYNQDQFGQAGQIQGSEGQVQGGQQGFQQGQPGSPGQGSQQTFTVGGQYTGPGVQGAQYQPNPSGAQVGSSGMVVSTVTYQGPGSGVPGAAGAAVGAGVAGAAGAAGAAANYNNQNPYLYSTSSMYSTTTPVPPRVSTTPGSTSGFQYSTQNPNDPTFGQSQGQQTQFTGGSSVPTSPHPSSQGYPSSTPGFTQQVGSSTPFPSTLEYQPPFVGQPIGQQNNEGQLFGSTQAPFQQNEGFGQQTSNFPSSQQTSNLPLSTPMPFSPSSSSQFTQGYPSSTPGYQGGFQSSTPGSTVNQASSMVGGYASTTPMTNQPQFQQGEQASMVGGYASTTPLPTQQQYQQQQGQQGSFTTSGPSSTTPFTYVFPGAQQNFGGSTPAGQTGTYPVGAQLDQSTTRQPNVNVAGIGGGQQMGSTASTMGPTASSGIGGIEGQGGQYGQGTGNMGPGNQGIAGSTGGGIAGFTPQYDFEHNMNTQYGHYNFTPSTGDGRMNDAPANQQQQQQTTPTQSSGVITPLLVLALSLLLF